MLAENKIHLGDCLDLMRLIPDKSIDLVLTDPPYGIGWDKEKTGMSAGLRTDGSRRIDPTWINRAPKNYKKNDWDCCIPKLEYFEELQRISKNQIIWGGNYFTEYLKPSGGWIVWEKGVPDGMTLSQAELAWVSGSNSIKITKHLWAGYKKCEDTNRTHPTQKPVKLFQWCLERYSQPSDLILDPFSGSGTTAIAAHNLGRRFICIEKDKDYHAASVQRLKDAQAQLRLF